MLFIGIAVGGPRDGQTLEVDHVVTLFCFRLLWNSFISSNTCKKFY